MNKALRLFLLFFVISLAAQAQSKEEKAVAAAVEELRSALISGDRAQLEKIALEELSYGHSSGLIEDKAAFVEALASGKSDFVSINLEDQTISIADDVALVRHKLTGKVKNNGTPGDVNLGVLLVWQKEKGAWKLLARQAYKL